MVGVVAEMISSFDESLWCLQNTVEEPTRSSTRWILAKIQRGKFDAVVARVRPVLDCINMEVAPQPNDMPHHPDAIINRCKAAWENFKVFNRDAAISIMTHALVVVWSHYPAIYLQAI